MRAGRRFAIAEAALAFLAAPVAAQLRYEGGLSVATGTYIFAQRTTGWTVTSGLSWSAGQLTLRATLPLLFQNTTLVTASGAGMIPGGGGGSMSGMVSDSGLRRVGHGAGGSGMRLPVTASSVTGFRGDLGDPLIQASWRVASGPWGWVTAAAGVKVPFTDTTAFGTGKWDVGSSIALTAQLDRRTMLGISGSYWQLGDLPELDFRNPLAGTVTLSRLLGTSGWGLSAIGSGATSPLAGYPGAAAAGLSVLHYSETSALGVSAQVGLTQTAPDLSVGIQWSLRFGPRVRALGAASAALAQPNAGPPSS